MKFEFRPTGVCSKKILFSLDDEKKLHDLKFDGGCQGNLKAISILLENMEADKIVSLLEGNDCGKRGTSCADQLAKALKLALKRKNI